MLKEETSAEVKRFLTRELELEGELDTAIESLNHREEHANMLAAAAKHAEEAKAKAQAVRTCVRYA